jgi:hypothetical protein
LSEIPDSGLPSPPQPLQPNQYHPSPLVMDYPEPKPQTLYSEPSPLVAVRRDPPIKNTVGLHWHLVLSALWKYKENIRNQIKPTQGNPFRWYMHVQNLVIHNVLAWWFRWRTPALKGLQFSSLLQTK